MYIYTMGFTQKSAETFFEKIIDNKIELLLDIVGLVLGTTSQ